MSAIAQSRGIKGAVINRPLRATGKPDSGDVDTGVRYSSRRGLFRLGNKPERGGHSGLQAIHLMFGNQVRDCPAQLLHFAVTFQAYAPVVSQLELDMGDISLFTIETHQ